MYSVQDFARLRRFQHPVPAEVRDKVGFNPARRHSAPLASYHTSYHASYHASYHSSYTTIPHNISDKDTASPEIYSAWSAQRVQVPVRPL